MVGQSVLGSNKLTYNSKAAVAGACSALADLPSVIPHTGPCRETLLPSDNGPSTSPHESCEMVHGMRSFQGRGQYRSIVPVYVAEPEYAPCPDGCSVPNLGDLADDDVAESGRTRLCAKQCKDVTTALQAASAHRGFTCVEGSGRKVLETFPLAFLHSLPAYSEQYLPAFSGSTCFQAIKNFFRGVFKVEIGDGGRLREDLKSNLKVHWSPKVAMGSRPVLTLVGLRTIIESAVRQSHILFQKMKDVVLPLASRTRISANVKELRKALGRKGRIQDLFVEVQGGLRMEPKFFQDLTQAQAGVRNASRAMEGYLDKITTDPEYGKLLEELNSKDDLFDGILVPERARGIAISSKIVSNLHEYCSEISEILKHLREWTCRTKENAKYFLGTAPRFLAPLIRPAKWQDVLPTCEEVIENAISPLRVLPASVYGEGTELLSGCYFEKNQPQAFYDLVKQYLSTKLKALCGGCRL